MNKPLILVMAAAGRTGAVTVRDLLKRGFPVRAFVRQEDARSAALKFMGAEIYVGDMNDYYDLRDAMKGVRRAYHCPPFGLNLLHNAMLFALAAEEAKLEAVALMSQWQPHARHGSFISREHWIANHIYRWMPSVGVIHINPGLFAFTYFLGLPAIVHMGVFMAPYGDGLNAPVSNEDIARVVAAVLADPKDHIGRSYRPSGPKLISAQDAAACFGEVLGRRVKYQDVPFRMFSKAGVAQGFPLSELAHLRYYAEDLKSGAFAVGAPTDHVLEVTGQPAEAFDVTAQRYFNDPSLVSLRLKTGSKASTIAFLIKMMLTKAPDFDAWERNQGYPLLKNAIPSIENEEWRATAEQQQVNLLPFTRAEMPKILKEA